MGENYEFTSDPKLTLSWFSDASNVLVFREAGQKFQGALAIGAHDRDELAKVLAYLAEHGKLPATGHFDREGEV